MESSHHSEPSLPISTSGHHPKCDLVGSTRTKKLLDLDGQLAFQRGIERVITKVARRHDAHIETFEGDGALVVFGFPQPREDAAEFAVRMGLEVVEAISATEIVPNTRLQFRVWYCQRV